MSEPRENEHRETNLLSGQREDLAFESTLRRDHPCIWWATWVGPFFVTCTLLIVFWLYNGAAFVRLVIATAIATFFVFGRFVILGGGTERNIASEFLSAESLTLLVFYLDLMTASLLAFHSGGLWKLPYIGSRLRVLASGGRNLAKNAPWIRRATFLSIVAFVMFPLAATGSIGGSVFGRLLGLGRLRTFAAVVLGSLLGCATMYCGAALIDRYVNQSNPAVTIGGIVAVLSIIVVLTLRYRKLTSAPRAKRS